MTPSYQQQTRDLIDGLKAVCASNGLGNDGKEYKNIVRLRFGGCEMASTFRPASTPAHPTKPDKRT